MPARPENQPRPVRPIDKFDPGWLFLVGGLVLLGFTVVIPAQTDLAEAQWQRDRALAIEAQRKERLFKHERYLAALESREPTVVRALAASQLNLIPAGTGAIVEVDDPATSNASVFPSLEPAPITLPELHQVDSKLGRWARDRDSRLWLIAAGSMAVLIGVLPWGRGAEA
jgi:hypothetical protein